MAGLTESLSGQLVNIQLYRSTGGCQLPFGHPQEEMQSWRTITREPENGDWHRAGESSGGFRIYSRLEPVPLFHSTHPTR